MGEDILRHSVASKVASSTLHVPLDQAAAQVLIDKARTHPSPCAVIAVDSTGQMSIQSTGRRLLTASCTSHLVQSTTNATTIALYPQHVFYSCALVKIGFTRYPTTPGHAVGICQGTDKLMSMGLADFVDLFKIVRWVSNELISAVQARRCGLVSDGSGIISLVPLHGLSAQWTPCIHDEREYHSHFPGYLTTKDGPRMDDLVLTEIQDRITTVTGLGPVFNRNFDGESSDQNIFARIVRGEVQHWRIWENLSHVAFLTPYGNTPGYTVLVPRKHLPSDVFQLPDQAYVGLLEAAHTVAQHLKNAFGVACCGMFFEGYEVDFVHVKLVPVHGGQYAGPQGFRPVAGATAFLTNYAGYLTSQMGPSVVDQSGLSQQACKLRDTLQERARIAPSKS